jgi:uncharacterized protein (TIGR00661 family)
VSSTKRKYLFIVQGEGRGHMTQALSLKAILTDAGHEVCAMMVGKSERRVIPQFFLDKAGCEVGFYDSPNFVTDKKEKGISLPLSVWKGILNSPLYFENIKKLHLKVEEHKPDVIINFFDVLVGIYYWQYKPTIPMVTIGHQYLFHHPDFVFPKGHDVEKMASKFFVDITAKYAKKRLALSFYELPEYAPKNIVVVPPLLRKEVKSVTNTSTEDFYLCYVLNNGYAEDIISWQKQNPNSVLHCFYDRKNAPEVEEISKNLFFHQISDTKFIDYMARCKGVVTSAGFESVCEAMFLGKPVLAIPTGGHYEQLSNGVDMERAGAGISDSFYNFKRFFKYIPNHKSNMATYKKWVDLSAQKILSELESV